MTELKKSGWNEFFEDQLKNFNMEEFTSGRVSRENKNNFILQTQFGEITAELSGKFLFNAEYKSDFPAVGDWVLFRHLPAEKKGIIEVVLERKSKFSRKVTLNKTDEQIIASNIDFLFIVSSLNDEVNIRRIERYLTLANESGLTPVIILSKSDLSDNSELIISELKKISGKTAIHAVSSVENKGMEVLLEYFSGNRTVAFVGSSGVGKSTLINKLSGEDLMEVKDISTYKDKGRHTTSHRELIILPSGGVIIDTPGMRELQMWEGGDGLGETFSDIENLISECKFSDCTHSSEPGCAVNEALENGELDEGRYRNYLKLKKEIRYFERRKDVKEMVSEKKKWKIITKRVRNQDKRKF